MKLGPKYKIARRLGAPIFEKTQTEKYKLSLARKEKSNKRRPKQKTEFGTQLNEKQKARFSYGISEKQFANYVKQSLTGGEPVQKLFGRLERRLDNVLYRAGLATTRAQARQIAAHGHSTVNGRRVTIPSILLKAGDKVGIREGSAGSRLFEAAEERMKSNAAPAWIKLDPEKREVEVVGEPVYTSQDHVFDLGAVIEFYSR
jgi:small subunit ribosomal protein S4